MRFVAQCHLCTLKTQTHNQHFVRVHAYQTLQSDVTMGRRNWGLKGGTGNEGLLASKELAWTHDAGLWTEDYNSPL